MNRDLEFTPLGGYDVFNMTPHDIVVRLPSGDRFIFPPSGELIKVNVSIDHIGDIAGIPVVRTTYTSPASFPRELQDRLTLPYERPPILLTSSLVAKELRQPYILSPDTGPSSEQDVNRRILSVRRFQTFYPFENGQFNNLGWPQEKGSTHNDRS